MEWSYAHEWGGVYDHYECGWCWSRPGQQTTHCTRSISAIAPEGFVSPDLPKITSEAVRAAIVAGRIDFIDGQWIDDPLLVLSMREVYRRKQEGST